MLRNTEIRVYRPTDQAAVIALWRACGLTRPQNDPVKDIARKLKVNPEWFLVAENFTGEIVGSVMVGYEGHRGWINYLAVTPTQQRSGLGRELMDKAEAILRAAGCPKINLQVRPDNVQAVEFYKRMGFAVEGAISLGKRLEHD
ncbi:GNAT family acetyltransferase [Oleiharenicola lentus]|uniref:GNAT family acetyltransferase n=1 Tax=Oleiharenicola lentus TaxID=2508720 RepID=UPI003F672D74